MSNIYVRQVASMKTAKLFKNGDSQAVRLPKEFRFEGTEVLIKRVGEAVVLLPRSRSWDTLVDSLAKFPPDFMATRGQPEATDAREGLD
jgi:antitoxin VapB